MSWRTPLPEPPEGVRALYKSVHEPDGHSPQVARLALALFDGLQSLHGLGERPRALLLSAALLHDIGWSISGKGHHKHSRDLILAADLPGLTAEERAVVACVARFHRKAPPDADRHEEYAALDGEGRRLVRRLAALLRIADGLDRGHRDAIQGLACDSTPGEVRIRLTPAPGTDARLEIWGAERKADLFVSEFGRRPVFQSTPAR